MGAATMPTRGVSTDLSPKQGTMSVSRGKLFQRVYRVPYLFESGTEATIDITDAAGVVLASFDGEVDGRTVTFRESAEDVDPIPHASNYEFSITFPDTGEPSPIEYGLVVRKEPRFTLLPPDNSSDPVKFELDFTYRTLLGPKFIVKTGRPVIHGNQPGAPNAISADWLFFQNAAMLFYAPVNGDDITVNVKVRNGGPGRTTIVVCSDYNMTEYLGVQFETGTFTNQVRIVTGFGPVAMTDRIAPVANVVNNDTYQIKFDSLSSTLRVFKNGSGTALASWHDADGLIGHGLGHRYWGANWQGSLLAGGTQVVAITAADSI